MIKAILLCVDGSQASARATETAFALAGALGAAVRCAYALDRGEHRLHPADPAADEFARQLLAQVLAQAGARGIPITAELLDGPPQHALADAVGGSDLVVIGRTGVGGDIDHGGLGSVAAALVRSAERPRVVVSRLAGPPAALAAAIDGSEAAWDALRVAAELARRLAVPLEAVHVGPTEPGGVLDQARRDLEAYGGLDARFATLAGGSVLDALRERFEPRPATLLALGARSRLLSGLLAPNTTERLLREARCNLLVAG